MPRTGPRVVKCRKCGSSSVERVDGSQCGGMPGITYTNCRGCGYAHAHTRRPRKWKPGT